MLLFLENAAKKQRRKANSVSPVFSLMVGDKKVYKVNTLYLGTCSIQKCYKNKWKLLFVCNDYKWRC